MTFQVIYEDSDVLVINKPFGVVANRADSVNELTVQDWVREQRQINPERWGESDELYEKRDGICHRLDKDTSGCLMIAKNYKALRYYLRLFKERKIHKTYLALVHGRVEPDQGEVVLPMKRSRFEREKWQVHFAGKKAWTIWKVIGRYIYEGGNEKFKNSLTLLEIDLKTGRTHQIRVHLSFLGWPLFGDDKYLNKDISKIDRQKLNRHFLHAAKLEFLSLSGEKKVVTSPLPEECHSVLDSLMLE